MAHQRPHLLSHLSLGVLGLIAGSVLAGVVIASPPPDPAPNVPVAVREQNLDANGWIKVHEQGTTNVSGTVEVDGDIAISNFPTTQDVNIVGGGSTPPQPVTKVTQLIFNVASGGSQDQTFPMVNVTSILIVTGDDEYELHAGSPLTNSDLFIAYDPEGDDETRQITFAAPMPLNRITLYCANESEACADAILLTGF